MNEHLSTTSYLTAADRDHLKTLSICSYVYMGLQSIGGLFSLVYAGVGATFVSQGEELGWAFVGIGAFVGLIVLISLLLTFFATRWMGQGKNWLFCVIIAGLHCAGFPLGTTLGVFTLVILNRPTVKAWFDANRMQ